MSQAVTALSKSRYHTKASSLLAAVVLFATADVGHAQTDTFHVYYLGGQSNMDGFGDVSDLPEDLNQTFDGVWIFHGNWGPDDAPTPDGRGRWTRLRPGHGAGFRSDGEDNMYSGKFGVELTFASRLRELHPGERIALIKYSRGGSSIDSSAAGRFGSWEPDFRGSTGINQYDHFLATIRRAMSVRDINGDGRDDRLVPAGIVWMQGESDAAFTDSIALRYSANVKRLIGLIRATFRVDDLPVVVGRISDSGQDEDGMVWDHGEIVRTQQKAFVDGDVKARLVTSTDGYGFSDPWHYDSDGFLDLGKKFAEAMAEMTDPATRPDELMGRWRVDLRPTPDAEPYDKEFVVTSVEDGSMTGQFYDTEIEDGHTNSDWGSIRFSFVTRDGTGPYHHSGELVGGRLVGTTHSPGRDFLSVWTATRTSADTR